MSDRKSVAVGGFVLQGYVSCKEMVDSFEGGRRRGQITFPDSIDVDQIREVVERLL